MFADVVDLVCVLARAAGAVLVRLVLQDLHPAALAAALLPALFLQDGRATASGSRSPPGGGLRNVRLWLRGGARLHVRINYVKHGGS